MLLQITSHGPWGKKTTKTYHEGTRGLRRIEEFFSMACTSRSRRSFTSDGVRSPALPEPRRSAHEHESFHAFQFFDVFLFGASERSHLEKPMARMM